jgi:hypothetical protein
MPHSHLSNAKHRIKRLDTKLHVIAVVFNPLRFQSRYNLYKDFETHALATGAELWTVECAFGDRPYEVTCADNPRHIQFRSEHELWHKERMINIAVSRLPQDWQYVAWVDADVTFVNSDWVHETMQQLQHYQVVQLFTHAMDVGPCGRPMTTFESFGSSYASGVRDFPLLNGARTKRQEYYDAKHWHPGYGWAYRREAWNQMGGLLDINIIGGGDHQMAYGLVGKIEETIPHGTHFNYANAVRTWGVNASALKRNVGAVPGTLVHHFHGKKKNRNYHNRWRVLVDNEFDPVRDLKPDWQTLYAATNHKIGLRDDLRAYFRARNEDSIDT